MYNPHHLKLRWPGAAPVLHQTAVLLRSKCDFLGFCDANSQKPIQRGAENITTVPNNVTSLLCFDHQTFKNNDANQLIHSEHVSLKFDGFVWRCNICVPFRNTHMADGNQHNNPLSSFQTFAWIYRLSDSLSLNSIETQWMTIGQYVKKSVMVLTRVIGAVTVANSKQRKVVRCFFTSSWT